MIPQLDDSTASEVLSPEEVIQLLEERLTVRSDKRKIGEIVVRKEIETRVVEVPVRREKLIVEQVTPTYKRLAEIDLSQPETDEPISSSKKRTPAGNTVYGELDSPKAASDLLDAIARTPSHDCAEIRIEIVLKDPKHQETYQSWFDRCRKP